MHRLSTLAFIALLAPPAFGAEHHSRTSADIFAGVIAGTPLVGADVETSVSTPLSITAEVVLERDSGLNSFEARTGFRYLLGHGLRAGDWRLIPDGKLEGGAITCANSNKLCGVGEAALGFLAREGFFDGSFIEVGYGQTDLTFRKEKSTGVMDLYVTHPFGRVSPFVGLSGSHRSFDAYLGISIDLR